jgi:uncharacterized membrane protein YeaQ/YmgE (transglycosylase-associated protein family)
MTVQMLLLWLAIGLVAGWGASAIMGGGLGLVGDVLLGIFGAVVATLLFRMLDARLPLSDIASKILVAFVGAVLVLAVSRLFRRFAAADG